MGYDDGVCDVAPNGQHLWELQGVTLGVDVGVDLGPIAATGVDAEYECAHCGVPMLRIPGEAFPGTV